MSASTDFSQWNPGAVNQENDSAYQGDSQRSGGASIGSIFPSATANKALYQSSTMVRALALSLVNKGFSPVDGTSPFTADASSNAAVTALASVLANLLTTADGFVAVKNVNIQTITGTLSATTVFNQTSPPMTTTTVLEIEGIFEVNALPGGIQPAIQLVFAQGVAGSQGLSFTPPLVGFYKFLAHIQNNNTAASQTLDWVVWYGNSAQTTLEVVACIQTSASVDTTGNATETIKLIFSPAQTSQSATFYRLTTRAM